MITFVEKKKITKDDYYRISFVSTLISIAKVTTSMVKMITFVEKKK